MTTSEIERAIKDVARSRFGFAVSEEGMLILCHDEEGDLVAQFRVLGRVDLRARVEKLLNEGVRTTAENRRLKLQAERLRNEKVGAVENAVSGIEGIEVLEPVVAWDRSPAVWIMAGKTKVAVAWVDDGFSIGLGLGAVSGISAAKLRLVLAVLADDASGS